MKTSLFLKSAAACLLCLLAAATAHADTAVSSHTAPRNRNKITASCWILVDSTAAVQPPGRSLRSSAVSSRAIEPGGRMD
jgi:hypothetical protein